MIATQGTAILGEGSNSFVGRGQHELSPNCKPPLWHGRRTVSVLLQQQAPVDGADDCHAPAFAVLLILAQSSAIAPFIYTLFYVCAMLKRIWEASKQLAIGLVISGPGRHGQPHGPGWKICLSLVRGEVALLRAGHVPLRVEKNALSEGLATRQIGYAGVQGDRGDCCVPIVKRRHDDRFLLICNEASDGRIFLRSQTHMGEGVGSQRAQANGIMNSQGRVAVDRLPKKPKRGFRIFKTLLYGAYLLLILEIASRLLLPVDPIFRRIRGRDDSTFRIDWIKRHGRQKDFTQKFDVYNPTRGWALKPGIKEMPVFDGKILNSNSKGLRGKTEYEYRREAGKRRILVLGDSFTFGDEVSDDETYPHYLESLLPDTEVLNFGVSGYGHDQMLLYLKDEGVKYKPDLVLLGFVYLDISRNIFKFFGYSKPKFESDGHQLHLTNVPVPPPEAILKQELYRSKVLDIGIILFEKIRWRLGLADERMRELTEDILDEIVATTRQTSAIPVFIYLPVGDEISNPQGAMTLGEAYLFGYCQERGIACLSLRRRFQEEIRHGAKFKTRGHWDANEHLTAAQGIRDYLLEKRLVQSDPGK